MPDRQGEAEPQSLPGSGARRIWRGEDVLAAGCMAVLVLITLVNVLVRYFSDASFAWTEEMSVFVMVVMVIAGVASAALRDRHLRIEALYLGGSERRRRVMRVVSNLGCALVFGLLAVLLVRTGIDEIRYGERNSGLDLPRWWFTGPLAILFLLAALRSLGFTLRRRRRTP